MKVGILTFHNPVNYGAVFQAYALRRTVSNFPGIDAEIIDYINPSISAAAQLQVAQRNNSPKGIAKRIVALPYLKKKCRLFGSFLRKNGNLSASAYDRGTVGACDQIYDAVIFGSDQIWNLKLTGSDWNYYGVFANRAQKIAYAASIGNFDMRSVASEAREHLSRFAAVSCRENSLREDLTEITGIPSECVLDPTLLLTGEEWRQLKIPCKVPQEYILLYLISPQKEDFRFAKTLSKKTGLPVLYVNYSFRKVPGVRNLGAVSPENFLYLLDNAKYVVTNSFHGTVLSINLHKDFYCQLPARKGKGNLRILDVVEQLGLKDRCLFDDSVIEEKSVPDWCCVDRLLDQKRAHSKYFLQNALEMNHEQTV